MATSRVLDELHERFGHEQVWVQCGRNGRKAAIEQAYPVARAMMAESHKPVAALHVEECAVANKKVCNCQPYIIFINDGRS